MSHELAEKIAGLASRVNDLAVSTTGPDSRALLELQNRLVQLGLIIITKNLEEEHKDYRAALKNLNSTIASIDVIGAPQPPTKKKVAEVIQLVTKAAEHVENTLQV